MTDTDDDRRQIVEEIITREGRAQASKADHQYQPTSVDGVEVTEQFRQFLQQALTGKLPDLGEIPQVDPEVSKMTEELVVMHLPEWLNPAGRSLAKPTTLAIPQAPRVADYLIQRGWRHHPEFEETRWIPTPGTNGGPYDEGMHIKPNDDGTWPAPDPEQFYDIDDIEVARLENGGWAARHPRGITFEADSKSEAYEGIVSRLRAKIEEAKQQ